MSAAQPTPADLAETSYRRGVHQALAFAHNLAHQANSLAEARQQIGRAEIHAQRLRAETRAGKACLIDTIRARLATKPKRTVRST